MRLIMRTSEGTIITFDKVIFTCSTSTNKPDSQSPGIPLADVTKTKVKVSQEIAMVKLIDESDCDVAHLVKIRIYDRYKVL